MPSPDPLTTGLNPDRWSKEEYKAMMCAYVVPTHAWRAVCPVPGCWSQSFGSEIPARVALTDHLQERHS